MPKKEDLATYIKNAKAKDLTQLMVDMKKMVYYARVMGLSSMMMAERNVSNLHTMIIS